MPFASEKQRRYMWAKHPHIAKKWADEEKEGSGMKALKGSVRNSKKKKKKKHATKAY